MITKKLEEMVRRQSALTAKMIDGTATDAEKVELRTLTDALAKATSPEPHQVRGRTTLRTVKLAAFRAEADALLAGDPTPDQLAVLKRNMAAVKDQAVTDPEGLVAVEALVELTDKDRLAEIEQRLKAAEARLSEGFDGRTRTGLALPADEEPAAKPDPKAQAAAAGGEGTQAKADGDTSIATQLATEAVDSLITRFTALREKIAAGTLKIDDVRNAWQGDWELRSLIEGAVAVLSKVDQVAALIKEVQPALEALDKATPPKKCPECGALMMGTTTCPGCGWKFEDEKAKAEPAGEGGAATGDTEKGEWPRGDMAGPGRNGVEQFRSLRKHRSRISEDQG